MAFYRSRRKVPGEEQPSIAAVERELERDDRNNLKMLAVIAGFVLVGFWLYAKTSDVASVTDAQPPAPPIERTTTGASVPDMPARPDMPVRPGTSSLPNERTPETPVQPKGPHPTEQ